MESAGYPGLAACAAGRNPALKLLIYNRGAYAYATHSPEATGGAEKQQWLVAKTLAARGHEIVVLVPGDSPLQVSAQDGVRFVPCSPGNPFLHISSFLRQERPDWWYWRCSTYILGPVFFIARLLGISTVFACAFDTDCQPARALARRKGLWPLYAWGLQQANRILVQHPQQQALLPRRFQAKAVPVNNIVEIEPVEKVWQDSTYVAWVGALRAPKRPHLLLDIARALPDLKFVVCGPAASHRSPQGYSQNVIQGFKQLPNVEYRGHVPPAEARAVIAGATALLSTAAQEGFPNTFLEAWGSGVPVLSLDVDPGNIIAGHGLGYVVSSVEGAIDELRAWAGDMNRVCEMGQNGRQYIVQKHSAEYVSQQLEAALGIDNHT